jgi:hypothetical protein
LGFTGGQVDPPCIFIFGIPALVYAIGYVREKQPTKELTMKEQRTQRIFRKAASRKLITMVRPSAKVYARIRKVAYDA